MESKVLQVFYGTDFLPYKDRELTIHFPIVGNAFQGSVNTNEIRFYIDRIGSTNATWVAVTKLPNGKIGSKVLQTYNDNDGNGYYAKLVLDSFYTQYKGDVYISLQGYQGGVEVSYDDETELYTIDGTPTIRATGSIKLTISYATQFVGSGEEENADLQSLAALIGTKLNIANGIVVAPLSSVNVEDYEDGQLFYDLTSNQYWTIEDGTLVLAEENSGILASNRTLLRYNRSFDGLNWDGKIGSLYSQDGAASGNRICIVSWLTKDYLTKISVDVLLDTRNIVVVDIENRCVYYKENFDYNASFGSILTSENKIEYLEKKTNQKTVYGIDSLGEQTNIPYTHLVVNNTLVERGDFGQIYVPLTPTVTQHATSKSYVDDTVANAIATVKSNAFILVNTTTYPTRDSFLASTGEEGYIYLYPINLSDPTKGYYQYIWENGSWLDIGTTQIDLSDYYTKSQTDDKFVPYTGATKNINLNSHSISSTISNQDNTKSGGFNLSVDSAGSSIWHGSLSLTSHFIEDNYAKRAVYGALDIKYTPNTTEPQYQYNLYFPSETGTFATREWTTNNLVNRTSSANKVYGTDNSGNQKTFDVDNTVGADGNIVRRASITSQIMVPLTPTANGHASSKKYVDDSIASAVSSVYRYKGTKTVAEINALTGQVIGDVYNVSDSGTLNAGNIQVRAGDNVAWTGSAWDKLAEDIDWTAYDEKFIAAGFFEVQAYNESSGEITFVYSTELYDMSYDSNTGIMSIEAN